MKTFDEISKDYSKISKQLQRKILGGEHTYSDHHNELTHVGRNGDHLAYGDGLDKGKIWVVCD